MSGTKGDPQQGEESPDFRTFVPSSAASAAGMQRRPSRGSQDL